MTTIASTWMTSPDIPDAPDLGEAVPADGQAEVLRLFAAHGSPLYRFCRFTLGRTDEAEDVVQDTFLKLLQHLHAGGNRSNLKSWLFTVAANACRDRMRGRFRWLPWRVDLDTRVVEPSDEAPDLRLHRAAARSLAPRDRLLLSLRAQGMSYREIAASAGIREQSVGRLLARAVARWKRRVEELCAV